MIQKARGTEPQNLIIPARKNKLTPLQDAALDVLSAVAKSHAIQLQINPAVLAPRKSLEDLIKGQRETLIMQGWRAELIGQNICAVLDGQRQLGFIGGELTITE